MSDAEMAMALNELDSQGKPVEATAEKEKYMIFSSNEILFGVNTDYVKEILTDNTVTFIPLLPPHISGVINMRGLIVPIINFRSLLGQGWGDSACIVVLQQDEAYVGIMVDNVEEMVDVYRKQILPVPYQSSQNLQNMVCGMCSLPEGGRTMMVLDCQYIFTQQ